MDSQLERIQDDLRGCIEGTVECAAPATLLYSTDGSIHQLRPVAVVCPRHVQDVTTVVKYAREHNLSIHPRGAGSFVSGESLGEGIILDFSRFMRRVFEIHGDILRVQPGVARERLNDGIRPFGLIFGPDGGNIQSSTIGGQIAVNSTGGNWLKYGSPAGRLLRIKAVLADGSTVWFDKNSFESASKDSVIGQLNQRLQNVYKKHATLIDATPAKSSIHHAGYNLSALREGNIDYLRLLAGSEGTLGVFTEFTLQLQPIPPCRSAILFFFDSIRKAAQAAKDVIHLSVDSCDLMDRRHLHLVSELDTRIDLMVPLEAEAALLVFCSGSKTVDIHNHLRILNERLCTGNGLSFAQSQSYDDFEVSIFEKIRSFVQPKPNDVGFVRPISYVDDVTVDPQRLDEFLAELTTMMQSEGIISSLYCHAPQGQMHLHPLMDLHNPEERTKLQSFATKYYELAWKYGGYLGRENGCGISRLYYLKQQSPEYYEVYRDIKLAFDPDWILQPGKIIAPEMPRHLLNLRDDLSRTVAQIAQDKKDSQNEITREYTQADELEDLTVLQMDWHQERIIKDCFICNDCGSCRDQSPGNRTCPIFRLEPREIASPRSKANLVRALALRQLELSELLTDEVKEVLDSCINCRSCQFECPVHTPVSQMLLQLRGAYVSAKGINFSERLIGQFEKLSRWAISLRPLAIEILKSPLLRKILEKLLGIAAGRKAPPIPTRTFLEQYVNIENVQKDIITQKKPKRVFFFVSAFANYHDVSLATAAMNVMQHNGIEVVCNTDQLPSGLSAYTMGMAYKAQKLARHNVNIMADAIRDGCTVVCLEPADTYCIKYEYPELLDNDADAILVSQNIEDLSHYLWNCHQDGKLSLKFNPIDMTLAYHAPCRLRALDIGYPSVNLMRLIPQLNVETIEAGCCGMAGVYGMQSKNYYKSIKIGMPLMSKLRDPLIQASSTDCSSCRFAMEHKSTKPCVHPIKILAYSYGLMPEIGEILQSPAPEKFLS